MAKINKTIQINPTAFVFWIDENFAPELGTAKRPYTGTAVGAEMNIKLPDDIKTNKDTALSLMCHARYKCDTAENFTVMMYLAQNVLEHYYGQLEAGKYYFLETHTKGNKFGPKASGEISKDAFNKLVEAAKKL